MKKMNNDNNRYCKVLVCFSCLIVCLFAFFVIPTLQAENSPKEDDYSETTEMETSPVDTLKNEGLEVILEREDITNNSNLTQVEFVNEDDTAEVSVEKITYAD